MSAPGPSTSREFIPPLSGPDVATKLVELDKKVGDAIVHLETRTEQREQWLQVIRETSLRLRELHREMASESVDNTEHIKTQLGLLKSVLEQKDKFLDSAKIESDTFKMAAEDLRTGTIQRIEDRITEATSTISNEPAALEELDNILTEVDRIPPTVESWGEQLDVRTNAVPVRNSYTGRAPSSPSRGGTRAPSSGPSGSPSGSGGGIGEWYRENKAWALPVGIVGGIGVLALGAWGLSRLFPAGGRGRRFAAGAGNLMTAPVRAGAGAVRRMDAWAGRRRSGWGRALGRGLLWGGLGVAAGVGLWHGVKALSRWIPGLDFIANWQDRAGQWISDRMPSFGFDRDYQKMKDLYDAGKVPEAKDELVRLKSLGLKTDEAVEKMGNAGFTQPQIIELLDLAGYSHDEIVNGFSKNGKNESDIRADISSQLGLAGAPLDALMQKHFPTPTITPNPNPYDDSSNKILKGKGAPDRKITVSVDLNADGSYNPLQDFIRTVTVKSDGTWEVDLTSPLDPSTRSLPINFSTHTGRKKVKMECAGKIDDTQEIDIVNAGPTLSFASSPLAVDDANPKISGSSDTTQALQVIIDSDGNNTFDPAIDTVYDVPAGGTNPWEIDLKALAPTSGPAISMTPAPGTTDTYKIKIIQGTNDVTDTLEVSPVAPPAAPTFGTDKVVEPSSPSVEGPLPSVPETVTLEIQTASGPITFKKTIAAGATWSFDITSEAQTSGTVLPRSFFAADQRGLTATISTASGGSETINDFEILAFPNNVPHITSSVAGIGVRPTLEGEIPATFTGTLDSVIISDNGDNYLYDLTSGAFTVDATASPNTWKIDMTQASADGNKKQLHKLFAGSGDIEIIYQDAGVEISREIVRPTIDNPVEKPAVADYLRPYLRNAGDSSATPPISKGLVPEFIDTFKSEIETSGNADLAREIFGRSISELPLISITEERTWYAEDGSSPIPLLQKSPSDILSALDTAGVITAAPAGGIDLDGDGTIDPAIDIEAGKWHIDAAATGGSLNIALNTMIRHLESEAKPRYEAMQNTFNFPSNYGVTVNGGGRITFDPADGGHGSIEPHIIREVGEKIRAAFGTHRTPPVGGGGAPRSVPLNDVEHWKEAFRGSLFTLCDDRLKLLESIDADGDGDTDENQQMFYELDGTTPKPVDKMRQLIDTLKTGTDPQSIGASIRAEYFFQAAGGGGDEIKLNDGIYDTIRYPAERKYVKDIISILKVADEIEKGMH